jgi:hypothetical protein
VWKQRNFAPGDHSPKESKIKKVCSEKEKYNIRVLAENMVDYTL